MEDYKEKYEQALEKAKICYKDLSNLDGVVATMSKDFFEEVFPELKESEDERVRKELINFFKNHMDSVYEEISDNNVVIAWLEKQGEQKPIDKVEPKFKVGDWIINSEGMLRHILAVDKTGYQTDYGWLTHDIYDNTYHLWTIQDAKDGDVLAAHECLVLFKEIYGLNIRCYCTYHYLNHQAFYVDTLQNKTAFHPATKEQRDLLYQKMKEAGYEWDAEKKELKKIEQKPVVIIPKFHEGDVIKPKDGGHEPWKIMQVDISDKKYRFKDGYVIHFSQENDYELVEQKSTWSEEDEQTLHDIILAVKDKSYVKNSEDCFDYDKRIKHHISWLKSLKERYSWKPSDEQIEALLKLEEMHVLEHEKNQENAHLYMVVKSIREQLLKLKGE